MNKITISIFALIFAALFLTGPAAAMEKGHGTHDAGGSEKIGDLFHESTAEGYMLSYYLMDMRESKKGDKASEHSAHGKKDMDKPHHIMVYIMDKDHKPVVKGRVGFLIKDAEGNPQKAMAMYMSKGFGITADMKNKGVYTIVTKAVLGEVKLMDKFTHEMK